jgi:hypothetical protein
MTTTGNPDDGAAGLPTVPGLEEFRAHKVIDGIEVGGHELPLRGAFYRRDRAGVLESVGVYSYRGRELFAAWGEVGRAACSFNAVRRGEHDWSPTRRGCPVIHPIAGGAAVVGFTILTPEGPRTVSFAELSPTLGR